MSDDLYPTRTRLALLREVRAGSVRRDTNGTTSNLCGFLVTSRVAELLGAGWVRLVDLSGDGTEKWQITDAGRAVLDGAS